MEPKPIPAEVAAIDAIFQQVEPSPIAEQIELPDADRPRPAAAAPPAPLRDYLRELQQEYAAQQERGKL